MTGTDSVVLYTWGHKLRWPSCLWLPSCQLCPFYWDGGSSWSPPQDRSPRPLKSLHWRFALVSPLRGGNEEAVRPLSCSPWKYLRREVTSWETSPRQLAEPGRPGSRGAAAGIRACFHMFTSFDSEPTTCLTFFPKVRKVKTKLTLNSFFPLCPILFLNKARG